MKILLVTNSPPFPSRDGVTVVSSHYIEEFRRRGIEVDLLYLQRDGDCFQFEEYNQNIFQKTFVCRIRRCSWGFSVFKQLTRGLPYFAQWQPDVEVKELSAHQYDIAWATPRSTLKIVNGMRTSGELRCRKLLGGVNDIASLRLLRIAKGWASSDSFMGKLRKLIFYMQSIMLVRPEQRLLDFCDYVHVQTREEFTWVKRNFPESMHSKFIVQANGVDDCLFDLPMERNSKGIVFVGVMDGMYLERIKWFVSDCLPLLREKFPLLEVTIIGRCSNQQFVNSLANHQINYKEFVENVAELYAPYRVLVAPIFKGYGLINKVIQSMAAGTIVVGDATAYNGILGFRDGLHGYVANSPEDFVNEIVTALQGGPSVDLVQQNAREIISKNFRWGQCAETVLSKISLKN
ncbi:glycosyltransferase family 4 protein [Akkermansiaceae bacterium]|nr:glycosyltransferase family 4 protein [Akkermansiaceae bacterium]MDA7875338.1 glycosyltransferase family 4 protein [Akkermansiaceae bacterium]MDC0301380.1 glycosyltransferase family 4 protein [Akkermansiaceae bacterium]